MVLVADLTLYLSFVWQTQEKERAERKTGSRMTSFVKSLKQSIDDLILIFSGPKNGWMLQGL